MDDLRTHTLTVPHRFALITAIRHLNLVPTAAQRNALCAELRQILQAYSDVSKATADFTRDDLRKVRTRAELRTFSGAS